MACMKKIPTLLSSLLLLGFAWAQTTPTPDKLWDGLFKDVQLTRAFGDNKTFVDMVPQHSPALILQQYRALKKKDSASLRTFVLAHFYLPAVPPASFTPG